MTRDPGEVLNKARLAFHLREYPEALEHYEYFFDHALDEDPSSFYGVRLSYCLSEWFDLGTNYPPALERLRQKRDSALNSLTLTRNPERFHDYVAICQALNQDSSPVQSFLHFHLEDPTLAREIVRFIWDKLVETCHWQVCSTYLPAPNEQYRLALAKFDQSMEICKGNPSFGGEEFQVQIEGWYIKDVANLLLVLLHSNRQPEAKALEEVASADMAIRGYTRLIQRINELVKP